MKASAKKRGKAGGGLVTVAESIGSTMGMIVGGVNAAQRAVAERIPGARPLRRRRKLAAGNRGKAKRKIAATRRSLTKRARAARRGLRRKSASVKRRARS